MRFRVLIPYQKPPNVEKHTPARARPSWPPARRFAMELASLVWDSYSWTYYLLHFVSNSIPKTIILVQNTGFKTIQTRFGMELVHEV